MNVEATIELVVVFKKGISPEEAEATMRSLGRPFREGMDSSRGKIYFYSTGPKFRLPVSPDEAPALTKRLGKMRQVYEVYKADWNIVKD